MNSYRSYGRRRYGAYRRRYGYGRSWRRNWYRYGSRAGVMQRNGRRSFVMSVPVDQIYTMTISAGSSLSNLLRCAPWLRFVGTAATPSNVNGAAQSLPSNIAYTMYTRLYDQVKILSVTHRVYICNPVGVSGGLPSMKVYTAWDRDHVYNDSPVTVDDLLNGPESQSQMFVTNSRAEFVRGIRATDLQERTTFHDCTLTTTSTEVYDNWWYSQKSSVGFSPAMSMAFEASDKTAADRTFQVSISSRYVVCFRNPKFGLSNYQPSNAKGLLKFGVDDVKVDEGEGKDEVVSDGVKKDVGDLGVDDVLMGDLPEIKEA